jgi:23S rRNA pseudouridine1911/1915/1917 synthase
MAAKPSTKPNWAKNTPRASELVHRLEVPVETHLRLDKFLAAQLPQYSRARLQGLIKDERVRVGKSVAKKTGLMLEGGERIEVVVPPPQPVDLVPENIPLDVIFENKDLIVINKPAGLVVHPAAGHAQGTLIHAVLAHAPEIEGVGGEIRPGLVHRLDKDTSGLIVLAKNELTQRFLQDQFQKREVEKTYIALVDGHPKSTSGRVDAPIGRDPRERKRMAVVSAAKGRQAVTDYRVVENFEKHTLLEANPHTGRTHQIRVHLAFIGCPVVGDRVYGKRAPSLPLSRHFLHALRLKLQIPSESTPRLFEAPLPTELVETLNKLRSSSRLSV